MLQDLLHFHLHIHHLQSRLVGIKATPSGSVAKSWNFSSVLIPQSSSTKMNVTVLYVVRGNHAGNVITCLEPLINCQCCFKFWSCRKEIFFLGLGVTVTEVNIKKVQKQDLKNIKNVKGCRDGMPKSMQTR